MALRVLLVEDNPDHALLTRRVLERDSRIDAVVVQPDAPQALAYLAESEAPRPDVVVVDLKLPGLSGFDLIGRLKEDPGTADLPVVILSTSAREKEVVSGLERGARAFLTKPLRVDDLVERLEAEPAQQDRP